MGGEEGTVAWAYIKTLYGGKHPIKTFYLKTTIGGAVEAFN